MEILKPGTPQKGWSTKARCTGAGNGNGGCGAELRVEQGDLYLTYSHGRDETDTHVTFTCAACGVETDLPRSKRPLDETGLPSKKTWQRRQANPKVEVDPVVVLDLLHRVEQAVAADRDVGAALGQDVVRGIRAAVEQAESQGWTPQ